MQELEALEPDFIVVAAFGQLLPERVLNAPKYDCINVHGSLLPKLRGAAPMQYSILQGDKTTGVTIMKMAKGLDTGDMISKAEMNIEGMTIHELADKLSVLGAELLVKTIPEGRRTDGFQRGCGIGGTKDSCLRPVAGAVQFP